MNVFCKDRDCHGGGVFLAVNNYYHERREISLESCGKVEIEAIDGSAFIILLPFKEYT